MADRGALLDGGRWRPDILAGRTGRSGGGGMGGVHGWVGGVGGADAGQSASGPSPRRAPGAWPTWPEGERWPPIGCESPWQLDDNWQQVKGQGGACASQRALSACPALDSVPARVASFAWMNALLLVNLYCGACDEVKPLYVDTAGDRMIYCALWIDRSRLAHAIITRFR